jgi:NHLM bacteriocin system ABC transporter peptidase/ATP-binding protein
MAADGDLNPAGTPEAPAPLPDTGRRRTPTILQLEAVECGAAALAMVLAYHGRHVPLEVLRVDCGVSRDGSKASGIARAARGYGMTARGFRKETRELADLPLPAIVFWNFNHFVVLEGFQGGRAWLNDPARGRRSVDAQEFDQAFTGVVITIEPGPDFKPGGHRPSVVRSLGQYLGGLRTSIAIVVFLGLVLVVPGLLIPWFISRFVDEVLVAHIGGVALPLLLGLLGAALARALLLWLQARVLTDTFGNAAQFASFRFFRKALSLPMEFYSQRSPGEIAARVDLNERVAEMVSTQIAGLLLDALTASFFFILMIRLEPALSAIVLAFLVVEMLAWRVLAARSAEISQQLSVQGGKLAGVATGGLANIESIKAGGQEDALYLKWLGLQVQFVNTLAQAQRATLALSQVPGLIATAANLAVLGLGAVRILEGSFTVGNLVAFQVLLAGFTAPVQALFSATQKVQTLKGDLARLDDVLDYASEPGVETGQRDTPGPSTPQALEFRDVSFGYNRGEAPLLAGFSLTVAPGRRVALVGASGSGKSTVARLAAGLFHPWSGEILYGGKPIESLPRAELAAAIAFVDQDVVLFEGSVRDNLSLWDPSLGDEAIRESLRDAAIEAEVAGREGGLDARLDEGARNLSGGQRQRLEIARALARSPRLLILDEATSALDPASEALVEANVRKRGITCLLIAHRLSTVRDADEILVLERGQVLERGTHAQLAAIEGGRYATLVAGESATSA